ncbi:MAG TPA: hypothetical protein VMO26_14695 [Vicinamibacterales bacterium]|nr:hypothetical protein [Vicinamibacterales bacterium]
MDTTQWLTYNNAAFGFALEYPDSFVVLREPPGAPAAPLVERVRFLEQFLAESETRDLHPPNFHIEIFARPAGGTLRQWLASSGQVPAGAAIEAFAIAGASESLRVADPKLIAPNEFYYAAGDRYIYKLTPIGDAGPRMLASFRIAAPR